MLDCDIMTASIAKPRPRSEVIMRLIQPVANAGVRLLSSWRVNPLAVVTTHAICGFLAAFIIATQPAYGGLIVAALLLQLKTLLDNMDGGLARATGQVTLMGRYFDTGMDFFVNIALFAALSQHGPAWLSLLAFALLTLLLSLDFNAERLYRQERQSDAPEASPPIGAPMPLYIFFKKLYEVILAPQDRLIARLDAHLFEIAAREPYGEASPETRRDWSDLFSTAALVNLGLSTQMVILGVCLLMGRPYLYVTTIMLETLYVICIQMIRVWRFRRRYG
jgi:archaetidylinositol phosphate synthase